MRRRPATSRLTACRHHESDRLFTPAFIALTLSELAYFTGRRADHRGHPVLRDRSRSAPTRPPSGWWRPRSASPRSCCGPSRAVSPTGAAARPLLVGGALLCAIAILGHLFATGLAILVALRLLLGVAEAFFFVAGYAALADLAPRGRTGEALSYNSLALYLGIAFGPIVGQLLLEGGGFAWAWIGGSALAAIATGARAAAAGDLRRRSTPPRQPRRCSIAPPIGPGLALFTGVSAMTAFLLLAGPRAEGLGLDGWSLTFLLFGGVVVGCRVAFARVPDRLPPMTLGAAALGLVALGLIVAAVLPGIVALLGGAVVLAIGVAFMTPALFAATFNAVPATERGAAAGTGSLFIDLGFGIGPLLAGLVAAQAGIPAAFAAAAAIAIVGAIGSDGGTRVSRREGPRRPNHAQADFMPSLVRNERLPLVHVRPHRCPARPEGQEGRRVRARLARLEPRREDTR